MYAYFCVFVQYAMQQTNYFFSTRFFWSPDHPHLISDFFRLYISLIIKNNVYFLWFAGKRKTRLDHSSNTIVLERSNIIFQVEDATNKNEGNGIKSYLFWKIWHRLQPSMFWETRRKQGFCLYLKKCFLLRR